VRVEFFIVNKERCKKDSICAKLCPSNIIKIDELTKYPYVREEDARKCIKCGQCISFCPFIACDVSSIEQSEPVDKNFIPSPDGVVALLKSRRSVRLYKKDGLPPEKIAELIDIANTAPTASNKRSVRWIVLSKREQLDEAANHVLDYWDEMGKAEAWYRRIARVVRSGRDLLFRGAPQLVVSVTVPGIDWHEDAVISLTYLEIIAHAFGAGMCWAGFMTSAARQHKPLRDYLGVLDGEFVSGAQMLGYPVLGIAKRSPVKPKPDITFR
jgi:nitroreductase/NAD-dependent dihydropyrimidine dehydrogenase PreA subunit